MNSKKSLITMYKNLSSVYGILDTKWKIKKKTPRVFTLDFLNNNAIVKKVEYNLNIKKILETKETFNIDLNDLIFNLNNKNSLNLLYEENKRRKICSKINGLFSIFKCEIDNVPVSLNTCMYFFSKISIKNYNINLMNGKILNNTTLSNFLPSIIIDNLGLWKLFPVHFIGSSKQFPSTTYSKKSFRIFSKLSMFKILMHYQSKLDWTYSSGLVFKCSVVYFLFLSEFCKEILQRKIHSTLQFFFLQNIFLKSITTPIHYSMTFHLNFLKVKRYSISETLDCFKFRSLCFKRLNFQKYFFFSIHPHFSRINCWIVCCFLRFIIKKFHKKAFFKFQNLNQKFFSIFYMSMRKKILAKRINFKKFKFNLGKRKIYTLFLLQKFRHGKYPNKKKHFLYSEKIKNLLKLILLSNKIFRGEKVKVLIKFEKKRPNFEIAIETTKNQTGMIFKIDLIYISSIKASFTLKIISNWHFFKILVSYKKIGGIPKNLLHYALVKIKDQKINVDFKSNFYQIISNFTLKKKKIWIYLNILNSIKKNLPDNIFFNYNLIFKLIRRLNTLYTTDSIRGWNLKIFSVYKKIKNSKSYNRIGFLFSLYTLLLSWLGKRTNKFKFFNYLYIKILKKKNNRNLNFFQKINSEYHLIKKYYRKNI